MVLSEEAIKELIKGKTPDEIVLADQQDHQLDFQNKFLVLTYINEDACETCLSVAMPLFKQQRVRTKDQFDFLLLARNVQPGLMKQMKKLKYLPHHTLMIDEDPANFSVHEPFVIMLVQMDTFQLLGSNAPKLEHNLPVMMAAAFEYFERATVRN